MDVIATRMIIKARNLIAGDVIMGLSTYESFVVEKDVTEYRNLGTWVVDVIGDTEDGDVRRECGEPEMIMVFADDDIEIIRNR